MRKHNASNERIKRRYITYSKEAKRYSETTVDTIAAAIHKFEEYTKFRDFKKFHIQQAIGFKKHLAEQKNQQTGKPLSKSTLHSTMGYLRNFFHWLAGQPGYKSRIQYSDADYFNISDNDMRVAKARREQKAPTLEQIRHVISQMPRDTEIERRNRALVAFTLLTGARDSAIASMKLKHVDLTAGCIHQDAREVNTKFSKTFHHLFLPCRGMKTQEIVVDWLKYLREKKLWSNDDPIFPATQIKQNAKLQFQAIGLDRKHWSNATAIRKIFQKSFEAAGLPYFQSTQLQEHPCPAWGNSLSNARAIQSLESEPWP